MWSNSKANYFVRYVQDVTLFMNGFAVIIFVNEKMLPVYVYTGELRKANEISEDEQEVKQLESC